MKVKELLELQSVITKRAIPSDMNEDKVSDHYSTSDDEYINILDMDLIHLIRSYSKLIRVKATTKIVAVDLLRERLDSILQETYNAREIVDKS